MNLKIEDNINEFFKNSMQSTPLSVFVLDWTRRIIYMNPAFEQLTGFRKGDTAMRRVSFSVHPDDREEAESSVMMAIVGRTTQCRCRIRGSKGSFHPLALTLSPLRHDERSLVLAVDNGGGLEKTSTAPNQM
jgi:PAS domain S-box-containing protein